jgi:hypothetical protein
MRKQNNGILMIICFIFLIQGVSEADWNFNPKLKLNNTSDFSADKLNRDLNKARKDHAARTGTLLGASIDFKVGYGATNASVNEQTNVNDVGTQSKGGVIFGALLNINILDAITLTTGLDFTKKNFDLMLPYSDNSALTGDSVVKNLSNSYLNIPLNIAFGGMVSEKVGLSFSGGPYFGILLNPPTNVSGYKDFDLGLNGILTANYLLNPFMSILLGTNVQYGGLNNLSNTNVVESAHTLNWNAFTGLRVGFDI